MGGRDTAGGPGGEPTDGAGAGAIDGDGGGWRVRESRRREYWSWVAGALYLLLSVDLLSTLYAAGLHGPAAEANPYVRWALTQDVAVLVALNLLALALLAALFYGYLRLLVAARGGRGVGDGAELRAVGRLPRRRRPLRLREQPLGHRARPVAALSGAIRALPERSPGRTGSGRRGPSAPRRDLE